MQPTLFVIKTVSTPAGNLVIGGTDSKIYLCDWKVNLRLEDHIREAVRDAGCQEVTECDSELTTLLEKELMEYFRGERKSFSVDVVSGGSDFCRRVLTVTSEIPYGMTASYKEIAVRCGSPRSIRAVASALASNRVSILIPCHRVIGTDGSLHGYAGSVESKEKLLALEKS